MKFRLAQIEFYFPMVLGKGNNKKKLVRSILEEMRGNGATTRAGYRDERGLHEGLTQHLGEGSVARYRSLTVGEKRKIRKTIEQTIRKCHRLLPVPTKNFAYVFPYFPTRKDVVFEGVMGFTPYSCVFHLFVLPEKSTAHALASTVAHELNHTIFFYRHFARFGRYTLLDNLVMEGLAECFREKVVGGKPAPWARALTKKEAMTALVALGTRLNSRNERLHQRVLFGGGRYKRWTGYSVGYWLVREFIATHPRLSWRKLMRLAPHDFLKNA